MMCELRVFTTERARSRHRIAGAQQQSSCEPALGEEAWAAAFGACRALSLEGAIAEAVEIE
jgi:hypothetical protein